MFFDEKRKYKAPKLEITELDLRDIIRTSDGVNSPSKDDPFGEWEI